MIESSNKIIYMDNAATTSLNEKVLSEMMPYLTYSFGNPSSNHVLGFETKHAINHARKTIANTINCGNSEDIIFTSCGTEANNMALRSLLKAYPNKKHIITSKIEHHSILNTCKFLKDIHGYDISYLDVDSDGLVNLKQLERFIRDDTVLISVMFANNEIGTIQPIKEIGEIAKEHNVLFHTDAVQAYGHIAIDVNEYNIDMMSVSGHKIHAPKGVGFLYCNCLDKINPLLFGGHQENGYRSGTENVASIVGLGKACELSTNITSLKREEIVRSLRNYMISKIQNEIKGVRINGYYDENTSQELVTMTDKRLANNINICMPVGCLNGESLVNLLSDNNICASSGSACNSNSLKPSHVLQSIGVPRNVIHNALRFTISNDTSLDDIDIVVDTLKLLSSLREN